MSVLVMVACNDERGTPTGHVVEVTWEKPNYRAEFMCAEPGPTFRVLGAGFRFGRYKFAHRGHRTWVGNVCWDDLLLDDDEGERLLRVLRSGGECWTPMAEEWDEDGAEHTVEGVA